MFQLQILHCSVGDVKTLPLKKNIGASGWKSDSKRGSQDSLSKTVIRILQCVPEEQFSLVDYIKGGCRIKFSAAIDFSSSNDVEGDPLHSKSNEEVLYHFEILGDILFSTSTYRARNRGNKKVVYRRFSISRHKQAPTQACDCISLRRS